MKRIVLVLLCVAVCGSWVWADEAALERKIDLLTQKLEAQQKHLGELSARLNDADNPVFRARVLNYEKEMLKLRNELRQGAGDVGGWFSDLDFYGKLRIRYELATGDDRAYRGTTAGGVLDGLPTRFKGLDDANRSRVQYLLSFGFTKKFGDDWEAGFGLASTVGDATTRNTTLDGYFAEDPVGIDRAWIKWHPKSIKGLEGLTIVAGKFENPFVHTDMTWDSDASPEGFGEIFEFKSESLGNFVPYIALGQLIADEVANAADTHCLAYQLGFNWDIDNDTFKKLTFAFTIYDWDGFEDSLNNQLAGTVALANLWPNGTRVITVAGNTVSIRRDSGTVQAYFDAGDFNIFNFTTKMELEVPFGDKTIPVNPYIDIAWNEAQADNAFGANPGAATSGLTNLGNRNLNDAIAVGVAVGKAKEKGDLEFKYKYAHIEANSIVGVVSDSTFGGANREGHVFGVQYMVHDNVSIGGNMYFVEDIYSLDHSNAEEPIFQFDVVVKF